ncbi:MAG TPA: hypothetical protein VGM56_28430 [Byssovorax sp.]|jgi:hypothetical protein
MSWPGRRPAAAALVAVFAALAPALFSACGDLPEPKSCGEIPDDGCPVGRGGTCDDPTCPALYDCVDGAWVVVTRCTPTDGGGGGGGDGADAGDAGGSGAGGGDCTPFTFDHAGEAQGCHPDLETPDCPAVVAEGCLEQACLTDCSDFFLCKPIGWVDVGYCDEDGGFHDTQRGGDPPSSGPRRRRVGDDAAERD